MLEDYLAYATLILSLIISAIMGYRVQKFLDHGETAMAFLGDKIIMFVALGIWIAVAVAAFLVSALLGLCGVSDQMLDYLLLPLTIAMFALAALVLKKVGKVMA